MNWYFHEVMARDRAREIAREAERELLVRRPETLLSRAKQAAAQVKPSGIRHGLFLMALFGLAATWKS